jgi:hypothetical protein
MSRLADRFLESPFAEAGFAGELPLLPRFVMDEAAEFFFRTDRICSATDYPTVAPPFPRFWMEFRRPDTRLGGAAACGAFVLSKDADHFTPHERRSYPDARWLMIFAFVMQARGGDHAIGPLGIGAIGVRPDGSVHVRPNGEAPMHTAPGVAWDGYCRQLFAEYPELSDRFNGDRAAAFAMMKEDISRTIHPFLFAISLMHCKNVSSEEVVPPEALNRARQRRGRREFLRYHTLRIAPMTRALETEGNAAGSGIRQALHLCRGHFKDYRKSGLFGRHKGLFWWDDYARGSIEEGVVAKDYVVGKPVGDAR